MELTLPGSHHIPIPTHPIISKTTLLIFPPCSMVAAPLNVAYYPRNPLLVTERRKR